MPRGFKLVHSILRGLKSPTVKKFMQWGMEKVAPQIGELLLGGAEKLAGVGMGGIAEKITDAALNGLADLPDTVGALGEFGAKKLEERRRRKGKEMADLMEAKRLSRRQARIDAKKLQEPYNHEPNATFPSPLVANQASAALGNQVIGAPGAGLLVYGNDQPFTRAPAPVVKISGRTAREKAAGKTPHPVNTYVDAPMSAKNTFGYLGWPGAANALPDPPQSVAGQYMRKVGKGTNVKGAIAAYGIDHPPADYVMTPAEAKHRSKKKKMAVAI